MATAREDPNARAPVVCDNPDAGAYEVSVGDDRAGVAAYRDRAGVRSFTHTEIDPRFAGEGLGSVLVRHALEDTRRAGLGVRPYCPFVAAYLRKHPDDLDLVARDDREQFDLPSI